MRDFVMPDEKRVLVAFSGGADSTALMHYLWKKQLEGKLEAVFGAHFNHCLRAEADSDEEFVRSFCRERGIECFFGRADVAKRAGELGTGIEETARDLRYGFLRSAAEESGALVICTAHNANDNVETVLFNLTRGTGLAGLRGIPRRRGIIFRPMLEVSRDEIREYLSLNGLEFVEDATNADISYSRNRLRHRVTPELREINPKLEKSVYQMTELTGRDEDFFEAEVKKELLLCAATPQGVFYPAARMAELHPALGSRLCKAMCSLAGAEAVGHAHILAMLDLAGRKCPSVSIELPGGMLAARDYESLMIGPRPAAPDIRGLEIEAGPEDGPNVNKTFNTFYVNSDKIYGDIRLRTRLPGDKISLAGRNGTKTLKKLFIDEKVPRYLRDGIPVIADDAGIIAVAGFGIDRSRVPDSSSNVMKISIVKKNK